MPLLLQLPLPIPAPAAPPADAPPERVLLEALARRAEGSDLRSQALVELMALEVACGNELAFERLRRELAGSVLPAAIASLFQARAAFGLARFGRAIAARRVAREAADAAAADAVREWLLEFDRRVDRAIR